MAARVGVTTASSLWAGIVRAEPRDYDPDQARALLKKAGVDQVNVKVHAADSVFFSAQGPWPTEALPASPVLRVEGVSPRSERRIFAKRGATLKDFRRIVTTWQRWIE